MGIQAYWTTGLIAFEADTLAPCPAGVCECNVIIVKHDAML